LNRPAVAETVRVGEVAMLTGLVPKRPLIRAHVKTISHECVSSFNVVIPRVGRQPAHGSDVDVPARVEDCCTGAQDAFDVATDALLGRKVAGKVARTVN
jgi:hypothetical protein